MVIVKLKLSDSVTILNILNSVRDIWMNKLHGHNELLCDQDVLTIFAKTTFNIESINVDANDHHDCLYVIKPDDGNQNPAFVFKQQGQPTAER